MRSAGNVIWFVFGGWYTALFWLIGAIVFAISIIGLPLTRAAIEMAKMSAFPFGKEVVHLRDIDRKTLSKETAFAESIWLIFNIIWSITFGVSLFFLHIIAGLLCCMTIIGIPFGIQSFKLAGLSFWPVGRRVVTSETASMIRHEKAQEFLAKHRANRA